MFSCEKDTTCLNISFKLALIKRTTLCLYDQFRLVQINNKLGILSPYWAVLGSYFQGKQHGLTKTFFPNAKLETERNYKDGIGYGRHFGYWQNGNKKFDFIYFVK